MKELLPDLKQRGLTIDPKLAIGDGALESDAASVWNHQGAALLGAQDSECC